jgi:hypothetical protein
MNILCRFCGQVLAVLQPGHLNVNGLDIPTEHLDGVILRCLCGRTRTYYMGKPARSQNGLNGRKMLNRLD